MTARFVEPRLGEWDPSHGEAKESELQLAEATEREKKGLRAAGLTFLAFMVLLAILVIPSNGILRDPAAVAAGQPWYIQIAPFLGGIVPIIMIMFLLLGIVYGKVAGTIKSDRDVARMSSSAVAVLGSYIVLAFAAAQFIAYFDWSNLGRILAIGGANTLQGMGFTGVPLLVAFVAVSAFINLFIGSASAKWAIMAPVFVPMLMFMGYSPELTQAAYRVGDSTTNVITPLMPYFPVVIAFVQKYDKRAGLGTLISMMLPYSIMFLIGWTILFAIWMLMGWPLGPGVPMEYVPA